MTYATQHISHGTCHSTPRPTNRACPDIHNTTDTPQATPDTNRSAPLRMSGLRNMTDIPHSLHHDRYLCNLRMSRHTQRNRYPTDDAPHRSVCTVTHARTYTARQMSYSQRSHLTSLQLTHAKTYATLQTRLRQYHPSACPTDYACTDIHNTTDTPQSAATARHRHNLRMPGHTQPPATARGGGADTSTGTAASPNNRHAIDYLDRGIRRLTARVWRAAAPRRPRSSSARAD